MPITASCQCGKSYTLKDEFAGKSIKCPACGVAFTVPASTRIAQADPIFDRDKFLIRQKRISISTKYFVGDEQGREIAFVHRPAAIGRMLLISFLCFCWVLLVLIVVSVVASRRNMHDGGMFVAATFLPIAAGVFGIIYWLAPKRHVTFYRDQDMREPLMIVQQNFRLALINARYLLVDAQGSILAEFHKNYLYNVIRKRWYVNRPDGSPLCAAMEDSIVLSLLRRLLGPALGLLRTNFMIVTPDFRDMLGEFNRKLTLFDKYVLDLSADPNRTLDRRVALALGVMLDTGENR